MACSDISTKPKSFFEEYECMEKAEIAYQKSVEQMNLLNKNYSHNLFLTIVLQLMMEMAWVKDMNILPMHGLEYCCY